MQYRYIGGSDLKVSTVAFGAWAIGGWMWGGTDRRAAVEAIDAALEIGVNFIDTAPTYGFGLSEEIVGEAIAGRRERVILATKCGVRWDRAEGEWRLDTTDNEGHPASLYHCLKPHSVKEECENSLRRLGTDYIDLYQIHWPDPTTPLDETMDALLALQREGKVRYLGVSNFTDDMMAMCRARGELVSLQPPYNALQREAEQRLIPYCIEHDMGVLAYSPIAQGLLTGKMAPERSFPPGDARAEKPLFSVQNRRLVQQMLEDLHGLCNKYECTYAQLFTAWLLAQPGVTTALVGARTPAQAQENAAGGDLKLEDEDIARIRHAVERLPITT